MSRVPCKGTRRRIRRLIGRSLWSFPRPHGFSKCKAPCPPHGAFFSCQSELRMALDRSFERRGIEDVPTIHLGPKAAAMERKQPGSSDRGDINREIARHNSRRRKIRQLRAEARRMMQRQTQAPAPRGGEIQTPIAREIFSRPKSPLRPARCRSAPATPAIVDARQRPRTRAVVSSLHF